MAIEAAERTEKRRIRRRGLAKSWKTRCRGANAETAFIDSLDRFFQQTEQNEVCESATCFALFI